jgi:hypothetical protein
MTSRHVLAFLIVAVAALGCGLGPDLIGLGSGSTPTTATLPAPTTVAGSKTPQPAGSINYPAKVVHQDASGDCILNTNSSAAPCKPVGLDLLSVTVTRSGSSLPVAITLELAGGGLRDLKSMPVWGLTYAFDLDRNVTTGLSNVYPSQHHVGPELTILYGEVNGSIKQIIKRYAPDGTESDADASLATWSFPDNNHIMVVVSPALIPVEQFYLVGDIVNNDMFDHFVEDGYLSFPEGDAVSQRTIPPLTTLPTSTGVISQKTPSPGGIIANAVMARSVKGLNAPAGITNVFPSGQAEVHAVVQTSNVSKGTRIRVVWIAVSGSGALSPNNQLGESEVNAFGTQDIDFYFTPNGGQMSPGTYRVEVYLNGKLDRSMDFTVAAPGTRVPTPASPTVGLGKCPPRPRTNLQPSGIVAQVTMAEGTQGPELNPANPTKQFGVSAKFHAVVSLKNAPANTKVAALWYATDVGDAAPCNATLSEPVELSAGQGSRNVDFNIGPPSKWPVGMYRVEIYVNDALDSEVDFTVK